MSAFQNTFKILRELTKRQGRPVSIRCASADRDTSCVEHEHLPQDNEVKNPNGRTSSAPCKPRKERITPSSSAQASVSPRDPTPVTKCRATAVEDDTSKSVTAWPSQSVNPALRQFIPPGVKNEDLLEEMLLQCEETKQLDISATGHNTDQRKNAPQTIKNCTHSGQTLSTKTQEVQQEHVSRLFYNLIGPGQERSPSIDQNIVEQIQEMQSPKYCPNFATAPAKFKPFNTARRERLSKETLPTHMQSFSNGATPIFPGQLKNKTNNHKTLQSQDMSSKATPAVQLNSSHKESSREIRSQERLAVDLGESPQLQSKEDKTLECPCLLSDILEYPNTSTVQKRAEERQSPTLSSILTDATVAGKLRENENSKNQVTGQQISPQKSPPDHSTLWNQNKCSESNPFDQHTNLVRISILESPPSDLSNQQQSTAGNIEQGFGLLKTLTYDSSMEVSPHEEKPTFDMPVQREFRYDSNVILSKDNKQCGSVHSENLIKPFATLDLEGPTISKTLEMKEIRISEAPKKQTNLRNKSVDPPKYKYSHNGRQTIAERQASLFKSSVLVMEDFPNEVKTSFERNDVELARRNELKVSENQFSQHNITLQSPIIDTIGDACLRKKKIQKLNATNEISFLRLTESTNKCKTNIKPCTTDEHQSPVTQSYGPTMIDQTKIDKNAVLPPLLNSPTSIGLENNITTIGYKVELTQHGVSKGAHTTLSKFEQNMAFEHVFSKQEMSVVNEILTKDLKSIHDEKQHSNITKVSQKILVDKPKTLEETCVNQSMSIKTQSTKVGHEIQCPLPVSNPHVEFQGLDTPCIDAQNKHNNLERPLSTSSLDHPSRGKSLISEDGSTLLCSTRLETQNKVPTADLCKDSPHAKNKNLTLPTSFAKRDLSQKSILQSSSCNVASVKHRDMTSSIVTSRLREECKGLNMQWRTESTDKTYLPNIKQHTYDDNVEYHNHVSCDNPKEIEDVTQYFETTKLERQHTQIPKETVKRPRSVERSKSMPLLVKSHWFPDFKVLNIISKTFSSPHLELTDTKEKNTGREKVSVKKSDMLVSIWERVRVTDVSTLKENDMPAPKENKFNVFQRSTWHRLFSKTDIPPGNQEACKVAKPVLDVPNHRSMGSDIQQDTRVIDEASKMSRHAQKLEETQYKQTVLKPDSKPNIDNKSIISSVCRERVMSSDLSNSIENFSFDKFGTSFDAESPSQKGAFQTDPEKKKVTSTDSHGHKSYAKRIDQPVPQRQQAKEGLKVATKSIDDKSPKSKSCDNGYYPRARLQPNTSKFLEGVFHDNHHFKVEHRHHFSTSARVMNQSEIHQGGETSEKRTPAYNVARRRQHGNPESIAHGQDATCQPHEFPTPIVRISHTTPGKVNFGSRKTEETASSATVINLLGNASNVTNAPHVVNAVSKNVIKQLQETPNVWDQSKDHVQERLKIIAPGLEGERFSNQQIRDSLVSTNSELEPTSKGSKYDSENKLTTRKYFPKSDEPTDNVESLLEKIQESRISHAKQSNLKSSSKETGLKTITNHLLNSKLKSKTNENVNTTNRQAKSKVKTTNSEYLEYITKKGMTQMVNLSIEKNEAEPANNYGTSKNSSKVDMPKHVTQLDLMQDEPNPVHPTTSNLLHSRTSVSKWVSPISHSKLENPRVGATEVNKDYNARFTIQQVENIKREHLKPDSKEIKIEPRTSIENVSTNVFNPFDVKIERPGVLKDSSMKIIVNLKSSIKELQQEKGKSAINEVSSKEDKLDTPEKQTAAIEIQSKKAKKEENTVQDLATKQFEYSSKIIEKLASAERLKPNAQEKGSGSMYQMVGVATGAKNPTDGQNNIFTSSKRTLSTHSRFYIVETIANTPEATSNRSAPSNELCKTPNESIQLIKSLKVKGAEGHKKKNMAEGIISQTSSVALKKSVRPYTQSGLTYVQQNSEPEQIVKNTFKMQKTSSDSIVGNIVSSNVDKLIKNTKSKTFLDLHCKMVTPLEVEIVSNCPMNKTSKKIISNLITKKSSHVIEKPVYKKGSKTILNSMKTDPTDDTATNFLNQLVADDKSEMSSRELNTLRSKLENKQPSPPNSIHTNSQLFRKPISMESMIGLQKANEVDPKHKKWNMPTGMVNFIETKNSELQEIKSSIFLKSTSLAVGRKTNKQFKAGFESNAMKGSGTEDNIRHGVMNVKVENTTPNMGYRDRSSGVLHKGITPAIHNSSVRTYSTFRPRTAVETKENLDTDSKRWLSSDAVKDIKESSLSPNDKILNKLRLTVNPKSTDHVLQPQTTSLLDKSFQAPSEKTCTLKTSTSDIPRTKSQKTSMDIMAGKPSGRTLGIKSPTVVNKFISDKHTNASNVKTESSNVKASRERLNEFSADSTVVSTAKQCDRSVKLLLDTASKSFTTRNMTKCITTAKPVDTKPSQVNFTVKTRAFEISKHAPTNKTQSLGNVKRQQNKLALDKHRNQHETKSLENIKSQEPVEKLPSDKVTNTPLCEPKSCVASKPISTNKTKTFDVVKPEQKAVSNSGGLETSTYFLPSRNISLINVKHQLPINKPTSDQFKDKTVVKKTLQNTGPQTSIIKLSLDQNSQQPLGSFKPLTPIKKLDTDQRKDKLAVNSSSVNSSLKPQTAVKKLPTDQRTEKTFVKKTSLGSLKPQTPVNKLLSDQGTDKFLVKKPSSGSLKRPVPINKLPEDQTTDKCIVKKQSGGKFKSQTYINKVPLEQKPLSSLNLKTQVNIHQLNIKDKFIKNDANTTKSINTDKSRQANVKKLTLDNNKKTFTENIKAPDLKLFNNAGNVKSNQQTKKVSHTNISRQKSEKRGSTSLNKEKRCKPASHSQGSTVSDRPEPLLEKETSLLRTGNKAMKKIKQKDSKEMLSRLKKVNQDSNLKSVTPKIKPVTSKHFCNKNETQSDVHEAEILSEPNTFTIAKETENFLTELSQGQSDSDFRKMKLTTYSDGSVPQIEHDAVISSDAQVGNGERDTNVTLPILDKLISRSDKVKASDLCNVTNTEISTSYEKEEESELCNVPNIEISTNELSDKANTVKSNEVASLPMQDTELSTEIKATEKGKKDSQTQEFLMSQISISNEGQDVLRAHFASKSPKVSDPPEAEPSLDHHDRSINASKQVQVNQSSCEKEREHSNMEMLRERTLKALVKKGCMAYSKRAQADFKTWQKNAGRTKNADKTRLDGHATGGPKEMFTRQMERGVNKKKKKNEPPNVIYVPPPRKHISTMNLTKKPLYRVNKPISRYHSDWTAIVGRQETTIQENDNTSLREMFLPIKKRKPPSFLSPCIVNGTQESSLLYDTNDSKNKSCIPKLSSNVNLSNTVSLIKSWGPPRKIKQQQQISMPKIPFERNTFMPALKHPRPPSRKQPVSSKHMSKLLKSTPLKDSKSISLSNLVGPKCNKPVKHFSIYKKFPQIIIPPHVSKKEITLGKNLKMPIKPMCFVKTIGTVKKSENVNKQKIIPMKQVSPIVCKVLSTNALTRPHTSTAERGSDGMAPSWSGSTLQPMLPSVQSRVSHSTSSRLSGATKSSLQKISVMQHMSQRPQLIIQAKKQESTNSSITTTPDFITKFRCFKSRSPSKQVSNSTSRCVNNFHTNSVLFERRRRHRYIRYKKNDECEKDPLCDTARPMGLLPEPLPMQTPTVCEKRKECSKWPQDYCAGHVYEQKIPRKICPILPKPKLKRCGSFKLPGCLPRFREDCNKEYVCECVKVLPALPSFSECVRPLPKKPFPTECKLSDKIKYLQPKNPLIENKDRFIIQPPEVGMRIDPSLATCCVLSHPKSKCDTCGPSDPCADTIKPVSSPPIPSAPPRVSSPPKVCWTPKVSSPPMQCALPITPAPLPRQKSFSGGSGACDELLSFLQSWFPFLKYQPPFGTPSAGFGGAMSSGPYSSAARQIAAPSSQSAYSAGATDSTAKPHTSTSQASPKIPVCLFNGKKIRLPGCDRATIWNCKDPPQLPRVPCTKLEPPVPSFSECQKYEFQPIPVSECLVSSQLIKIHTELREQGKRITREAIEYLKCKAKKTNPDCEKPKCGGYSNICGMDSIGSSRQYQTLSTIIPEDLDVSILEDDHLTSNSDPVSDNLPNEYKAAMGNMSGSFTDSAEKSIKLSSSGSITDSAEKSIKLSSSGSFTDSAEKSIKLSSSKVCDSHGSDPINRLFNIVTREFRTVSCHKEVAGADLIQTDEQVERWAFSDVSTISKDAFNPDLTTEYCDAVPITDNAEITLKVNEQSGILACDRLEKNYEIQHVGPTNYLISDNCSRISVDHYAIKTILLNPEKPSFSNLNENVAYSSCKSDAVGEGQLEETKNSFIPFYNGKIKTIGLNERKEIFDPSKSITTHKQYLHCSNIPIENIPSDEYSPEIDSIVPQLCIEREYLVPRIVMREANLKNKTKMGMGKMRNKMLLGSDNTFKQNQIRSYSKKVNGSQSYSKSKPKSKKDECEEAKDFDPRCKKEEREEPCREKTKEEIRCEYDPSKAIDMSPKVVPCPAPTEDMSCKAIPYKLKPGELEAWDKAEPKKQCKKPKALQDRGKMCDVFKPEPKQKTDCFSKKGTGDEDCEEEVECVPKKCEKPKVEANSIEDIRQKIARQLKKWFGCADELPKVDCSKKNQDTSNLKADAKKEGNEESHKDEKKTKKKDDDGEEPCKALLNYAKEQCGQSEECVANQDPPIKTKPMTCKKMKFTCPNFEPLKPTPKRLLSNPKCEDVIKDEECPKEEVEECPKEEVDECHKESGKESKNECENECIKEAEKECAKKCAKECAKEEPKPEETKEEVECKDNCEGVWEEKEKAMKNMSMKERIEFEMKSYHSHCSNKQKK